MELREFASREKRSNDYAWCQPRRETLKEIHVRGFNLSEEIKQAKVDEADANSFSPSMMMMLKRTKVGPEVKMRLNKRLFPGKRLAPSER